MHKDYYCAYHLSQVITSFCRRPECLLPACATCLRLHTEEHDLNKTQPIYDRYQSANASIKTVIIQVDQQLHDLGVKIEGLQQSLLVKERRRKEEMARLKQLIAVRRREVISEFENAIKQLDRRVVDAIYQIDKDFILEIEGLDDEILSLSEEIESEKSSLRSEESLGTIISYLYEGKCAQFEQKIHKIEHQIQNFMRKSINVSFDPAFKPKLAQNLQQLISISEVAAE